MSDPVRVRFAPSPTGPLHIGGARTALFNFVFARKNQGRFVLRIDDTDTGRSEKRYEEDILSGLRWLEFSWDEGPDIGGDFGPYRQSEKLDRYARAAEQLTASDKAYLDDGGALRLRYPSGAITVDDLICGQCIFGPESLGPEPVIVRSDGVPTYHLASVVDDIDMQITHVIRGQDHLTNTAKHQVLFQALGSALPRFAHLPLILSEEGGKLSKRSSEGLITLTDFSRHGYLKEALINFLALLGWSHPKAKEQLTLEEIVEAFAIERVGKTGSIFDSAKLDWLNGHYIRHLPLEDVAERALAFTGELRPLIEKKGLRYWLKAMQDLRDSMSLLTDAHHVAALLLHYELPFSENAREKIRIDRETVSKVCEVWLNLISDLASEDEGYSAEQANQLMNRLKKAVEIDKKSLFQSLRICVMGDTSGPELKLLLPLVSRDILISRAEAVRAVLAG